MRKFTVFQTGASSQNFQAEGLQIFHMALKMSVIKIINIIVITFACVTTGCDYNFSRYVRYIDALSIQLKFTVLIQQYQ